MSFSRFRRFVLFEILVALKKPVLMVTATIQYSLEESEVVLFPLRFLVRWV